MTGQRRPGYMLLCKILVLFNQDGPCLDFHKGHHGLQHGPAHIHSLWKVHIPSVGWGPRLGNCIGFCCVDPSWSHSWDLSLERLISAGENRTEVWGQEGGTFLLWRELDFASLDHPSVSLCFLIIVHILKAALISVEGHWLISVYLQGGCGQIVSRQWIRNANLIQKQHWLKHDFIEKVFQNIGYISQQTYWH